MGQRSRIDLPGRDAKALRSAVSALLMLAVLVTGLVPQGMMPVRDAAGHLTVVICTTEGLRAVTLDAAGREVPRGDEDGDRSPAPCLFATAIALVSGTGTPQQPSFAVATAGLAPAPRGEPVVRHTARPLGARAPPVTL